MKRLPGLKLVFKRSKKKCKKKMKKSHDGCGGSF